MKAPENVQVIEGDLASFWLEEPRLLCAIAKGTVRNRESQQASFDLIRTITKGNKVCLLTEISKAGIQDPGAREVSSREIAELFFAMATLSTHVYGKLITETFIQLQGEPIPIRHFTSESQARIWLTEVLKEQGY